MMERGVGYGTCENCGVMVDLKFMKKRNLLNGRCDDDTDWGIIGETCWNGYTRYITWDCPVCKLNNDTEIPIGD